MKINIIVCIFSIILLNGCTSTYMLSLNNVERPINAQNKYGEQKITPLTGQEFNGYGFEDKAIKIIWIANIRTSMPFVVQNKTDQSIKIIWDEAAFVDCNGGTHRIMHSGVKYIDRSNSQPPSMVVRNGTLSDTIIPSDNIYFMSGQYGGWKERSLLPAKDSENARYYIGKNIQVLLPLQIESITYEYIFSFIIQGVDGNTDKASNVKIIQKEKPPSKKSRIIGASAMALGLSIFAVLIYSSTK
jgi:hypothetical protein